MNRAIVSFQGVGLFFFALGVAVLAATCGSDDALRVIEAVRG